MYSKVLVPVSRSEDRNSEAAFAMARHLVSDVGEIHAIHVIESVQTFSEAYIPEDLAKEINESARVDFEKQVPDDVAIQEVLFGSAGVSILGYAEKIGADCIVIASHRPGLSDYFLGSTAARVVRHAKCSVHVLR